MNTHSEPSSCTLKCLKFCLLLSSLLFCSLESFSQRTHLTNVKLEFTDFSTQTLVAVSCTDFGNMFKSTIKRSYIRKKSKLALLENSTKKFVLIQGQEKVDVRGNITFYYKKILVKYCFDRYGLFYKNGKYFRNKHLMAIISDTIDGVN